MAALDRFYCINNYLNLVHDLQIQYDKQCGEDNICDTDLAMIVKPLVATEGYIIAGETKRLEVKVDLSNIGENAYNLILDMEIHGNLSSESLRTKDTGKISPIKSRTE